MPLMKKLTRTECCCGMEPMGRRGWGQPCQPCPLEGSGMIKIITKLTDKLGLPGQGSSWGCLHIPVLGKWTIQAPINYDFDGFCNSILSTTVSSLFWLYSNNCIIVLCWVAIATKNLLLPMHRECFTLYLSVLIPHVSIFFDKETFVAQTINKSRYWKSF